MPPAAGVGKVFLPALFLCLLAKNQPSVRKQQPHIALGSRTCGRYAGWFLFYFIFFFHPVSCHNNSLANCALPFDGNLFRLFYIPTHTGTFW